jgi:hypothetical protein
MSSRILVETLQHPARYTPAQLERATQIAETLRRGRLVLCEPPDQRR